MTPHQPSGEGELWSLCEVTEEPLHPIDQISHSTHVEFVPGSMKSGVADSGEVPQVLCLDRRENPLALERVDGAVECRCTIDTVNFAKTFDSVLENSRSDNAGLHLLAF